MLSYVKQTARQIRVALFLPCSLAGQWSEEGGEHDLGQGGGLAGLLCDVAKWCLPWGDELGKKNCLGKHNSFFQSHLPRRCKVFVWIDD